MKYSGNCGCNNRPTNGCMRVNGSFCGQCEYNPCFEKKVLERLACIEALLTNPHYGLEAIQNNINNLTCRVDKIEEVLCALAKQVACNTKQLQEFGTDLAALETAVADLETAVAGLDNNTDDIDKILCIVKKILCLIQQLDLTDLKSLEAIKHELDCIKAALYNCNYGLPKIADTVDDIQETISNAHKPCRPIPPCKPDCDHPCDKDPCDNGFWC